MKTSESINKIAPALLAAQKKITFAAKDATNPHYKNKYADLPAVIDAIKIALNDEGVMFMQSPSPSEHGTLALTTRLIHSSGEWIEDVATVPLPKNDPQGYGSAVTYARRYSLSSMTGLYQEDDDGCAAMKPAKEVTLSVDQIDMINQTAIEKGVSTAKILKYYKAKTFAEIPASTYTEIINGLEAA